MRKRPNVFYQSLFPAEERVFFSFLSTPAFLSHLKGKLKAKIRKNN
jgi:hypothetical protein